MFHWREVFCTMDKTTFEKVRNELDEKHLDYKVKIKDTVQRLTMNNFDGHQRFSRSGVFQLSGCNNVFYYIYVKNEAFDEVKYIIQNIH